MVLPHAAEHPEWTEEELQRVAGRRAGGPAAPAGGEAAGPSTSGVPLVDVGAWEAMTAEELVVMATQLQPQGQLAEAVRYAGPDLRPATPLPAAELAALYQPPRPEFQAGLVLDRQAEWLQLLESTECTDADVQRWVESRGWSEYLPQRVPFSDRSNSPSAEAEGEFVTGAVADLLRCNAVSDVTAVQWDEEEVRVIRALMVAVQPLGKKRLCWDGRVLNAYIPDQPFKMEHLAMAVRQMQAGDRIMSLDMKSGYLQVPVKPAFRKHLCFRWQGRVYRFEVMCFGVKTGPRVFTKLMRCLLKHWRRQGIRCSMFIDDAVFFARTDAAAERLRALVLGDLTRLGWFISPEKSMLQWGTTDVHLGLQLCSVPVPHLRVPEGKLLKMQALARGLCRRAEGLPAGQALVLGGKELAGVLGFVQSLRLALIPVAAFTRELYPLLEWGRHMVLDFSQQVQLTPLAVLECRFLAEVGRVWNGCLLQPLSVSRVLTTDASGQGYGGLLRRVAGRREQEEVAMVMAGQWEAVVAPLTIQSVWTELEGLWRCLVAAGAELAGQVVLSRTDSVSTFAVLANGGARQSPRLTNIVRRIVTYCMVANVHLAVEWVGSAAVLRSGADLLSRLEDETDCRLQPELFAVLWQRFGPFAADMFATNASVQLSPETGRPLAYWGRWLDARAAGVDGLSARWGEMGGVCYAFPPPSLVGPVVLLLDEQGAAAVLVVPRWEAQWWWPVLLRLAERLVDLDALACSQGCPVLLPARPGGPAHPFGRHPPAPHSGQWVVAVVPGRRG